MMTKHCRLENCKAPRVDSTLNPGTYGDHGLCKRHYSRLDSGFIDTDGNWLKPLQRNRLGANKCRVMQCMALPKCVGLCSWHYRNMNDHEYNTAKWAVDYEDTSWVISYQDWDSMRKPILPTKPLNNLHVLPDVNDDDQRPSILIAPPKSIPQMQKILDLGDSPADHPDVIILNGTRFVPDTREKQIMGMLQRILEDKLTS